MNMIDLIVTSLMLGVGLAMDAFSVSLANGLADNKMKFGKVSVIAGTFAMFQFAMPMIGWAIVHLAAEKLAWFAGLVPWIAVLLLGYIGSKMIKDGLDGRKGEAEIASSELGFGTLMMQGVATSLDALSVGFTTSTYGAAEALLSALIIGIVTFVICVFACLIGKKAGGSLSWKAPILGGIILIVIALRIIITSDVLKIIT